MKNQLANYRKSIDLFDDQIIKLLKKRFEIVEKIGLWKKKNKTQPLDEKRWREVLDAKINLAKKLRLNEEFVKKLYELIHSEALEIEK